MSGSVSERNYSCDSGKTEGKPLVSSYTVGSSALESEADDELLEEEDDVSEEPLETSCSLLYFFVLLAPGGRHITQLSRLFIIRARIYEFLSFLRKCLIH